MERKIYLDYAATTPTDPEVVAAMLPYFSEKFGNPSSLHTVGQEAKAAVEEAREKIARFIGASADEIVFTSGGTESNNTALKGVVLAKARQGNHLITSSVEHHSVVEAAYFLKTQGYKVTFLPVMDCGLVDPESVREAITPETVLISIMHANNEIGTIQPIAEIGQIAREKGIIFHVDAVQTLGHLPVKVDDLKVDLLSASGHKLYGPKGVGLLYIRRGTKMEPLLHGGSQERGWRASTHNLPGIVGFGQAVELAQRKMEAESIKLTELRDYLISRILKEIPDTFLNGHPRLRLPNNVNVSFLFIEGEALILNLDLAGIACSTGSACSSGSMEPSHVLKAINLPPERSRGALRFSLGRQTKKGDLDYLVETLKEVVAKLRVISPLSRK
jgi:cysteine desulfurase